MINAYLQPVMQRYLENLQFRADELTRHRDVASNASLSTTTTGVAAGDSPARFGVARSGAARSGAARFVEERRFSVAKSAQKDDGALAPARIFVMQSSGGITALSTAAREPVRTVLSGPAGGVVGAAATARASGFDRIIAFDMGGTSTDVSLVEGEIKTATDAHIAGVPISVPMLDIHTVGAGGGSLARFDAAGVLHVGPESAGADPGPICYGRGTQPTVTDANLLLGRLQPTRFLGGDFTLDLDRTRHITQEWLKKQRSRLTLQQFAAGVIRVVNATMEKAIRVVSIERGRDPRDFALVAFGGAGGLHACALAESLSIPHVIVPAFPGALSALGILASNVVKDYSRTVLWSVSGKIPTAQLNQEFAALEETAAKDFRRESWQGRLHYARSIDLRYRGQGYELNLSSTKDLLKDFEQEHLRRYGYTHPKSRSRVGNPPPPGSREVPADGSHHGSCGDGRPRPSRPSNARQALLAQSPSAIRRQDPRNENPLPRRPPPWQKIPRPRHHLRIQRHHSHPAPQPFPPRPRRQSSDLARLNERIPLQTLVIRIPKTFLVGNV